jgi:hypothetical protein
MMIIIIIITFTDTMIIKTIEIMITGESTVIGEIMTTVMTMITGEVIPIGVTDVETTIEILIKIFIIFLITILLNKSSLFYHNINYL